MRKTLAVRLALATLAFSTVADAQAYPTKPMRIVVPFAVGGIADTFGRAIAAKLTESWGQPVVVENRVELAATSGRTWSPSRLPTGTRS